ncbi:hypothetical protein N7488_007877 [Penicillium malachiteum]|nr:hypothetical protein N7488_007877 [Penicillium malachiteum]
MNSPPKRRRSANIAGDAGGASHLTMAGPAIAPSGRLSFQSPTRSSLAKSHPEVLERALSRSPSRQPTSREPRGKQPDRSALGLRGRKALRPSLGGMSSPLKERQMPDNSPLLSPAKRPSGIQSFTKPPRRLSRKIVPGDFLFGSPTKKEPYPTEEDLSNTPEGQLASELGSATREADTREAIDVGFDGAFDDNSLEPDLPPTPTQLGLEKAPDRPRGLLSSSPSARHEKHRKRKAIDAIQGSPLKTMRFRHQSPEASVSDIDVDDAGLSMAALEKRKLRKSLTAELQKLKDDVAELTEWTGKIESNSNLNDDPHKLSHFLDLLSEESSHINRPMPRRTPVPISSLLCTLLPFSKNIPRPSRQTSPLPMNPFALKESSYAPSYLTVFAPLALQTSTSRSTASRTSTIVETHTLTFTPPSPFPSSLYNISVVYETDPEAQAIVSVSVPTGSNSKKRRVPEVLRRWIEARLANPLLKLDVATLCWGINRYWEASISRAELWAYIDHKYGSGEQKGDLPKSQPGVLMLSELRRLIPHLERSTMVIKSKSERNAPRVLLSNALTIDDWTGEPQLRPELSVSTSSSSGASKKIDQETKKLFHALVHEDNSGSMQASVGSHSLEAIIRATEGAMGALFGRD